MNSTYEPLIRFWGLKIEEDIIKNKLSIEKSSLISEKKILKFDCVDELRPAWLSKGVSPYAYCSSLYKNEVGGKILATFAEGNQRYPAIIKQENGKIIYNFDITETIDFIIKEKYFKSHRPFYTYFPVITPNLVPRNLRKSIKGLMMFLHPDKECAVTFPQWPIEVTVELLRTVFLNSLKLLYGGKINTKPFWPENKKYALLLTHDVDSKAGFSQIKKIANLEEKYNFLSTWFIPAYDYKIDFSILDEIVVKGHYLGLHGDRHDNKIAFLSRDEIKKRLDGCSGFMKRYAIDGFRSPSLFRSPQLFDTLADYFLYDSSVPDAAKLSPNPEVNGACTVFPYMIGNLVELPITVPLDSSLIFLGYTQKDMVSIWKEKIKWIREIGGMAVLDTHPEPHFIAHPSFMKAYDELLSWLSEDNDFWLVHPREAAEWWKERYKNE